MFARCPDAQIDVRKYRYPRRILWTDATVGWTVATRRLVTPRLYNIVAYVGNNSCEHAGLIRRVYFSQMLFPTWIVASP